MKRKKYGDENKMRDVRMMYFAHFVKYMLRKADRRIVRRYRSIVMEQKDSRLLDVQMKAALSEQ